MTSKLSPTLQHLLEGLRAHPAFPELLKAIPAPKLRRFKISQAQEAEKARAEWVYLSGRCDHHDQWTSLLTGRESETSQQET